MHMCGADTFPIRVPEKDLTRDLHHAPNTRCRFPGLVAYTPGIHIGSSRYLASVAFPGFEVLPAANSEPIPDEICCMKGFRLNASGAQKTSPYPLLICPESAAFGPQRPF